MKNLLILTILALPLFGMGQEKNDSNYNYVYPTKSDTTRTYKEFCECYEVRTKDYVWWEDSPKKDTIPVLVSVQYTNRDATILREAYLINGEPWYRSPAPLTRGKWIKIRCVRWKVEKDWITNKK